jgi:protein-L-isoaspartate(D-aspartate) O-methyltransferase
MLKKYKFVKTEYPYHLVSEAIKSTRGRNPDGTPKIHNTTNDEMVDSLEKACEGLDIDLKYFNAFRELDRAVFIDWNNVPQKHKDNVGNSPYNFLACVFGEGQTVPAANMLLTSLVLMDFKPNQKILEIGAGSGYYASLAAKVAGENSQIVSTEIIPEFVERARRAVKAHNLSDKVTIVPAFANILGSPENGPYDRIVTTVACSKERHLSDLLSQLKVGGVLSNSIIGLYNENKQEIEPWRPGNNISQKNILISDPSKDFAYVVSYKFTKLNKNTIQYSVKNNINLERITGAGPYFK